jgi:hypothetical protein
MVQRNTLFWGIIICFILFTSSDILAEESDELTLKERIIILETKVEEGFKAVNQRIDSLEKRIDDLRGLIYVILAGIIALIGFIIWDRRTALAPA